MKGKYIELGNAKEGRVKVRNRVWEKGKVEKGCIEKRREGQ